MWLAKPRRRHFLFFHPNKIKILIILRTFMRCAGARKDKHKDIETQATRNKLKEIKKLKYLKIISLLWLRRRVSKYNFLFNIFHFIEYYICFYKMKDYID